jgi:hypothetical protein
VIAILLVLITTVLVVRKTIDFIGITPKHPYPMGPGLMYGIVPLCIGAVYHPIRRRIAMYEYVTWLKSFEEPQPQPPRGQSWRLAGIFGRFGTKSTGVSQVSIKLQLRGRGDAATDLIEFD